MFFQELTDNQTHFVIFSLYFNFVHHSGGFVYCSARESWEKLFQL